jgi:hypothetical protein
MVEMSLPWGGGAEGGLMGSESISSGVVLYIRDMIQLWKTKL